MRISELISELEDVKRMVGDVRVFAGKFDKWDEVIEVSYCYEENTVDLAVDEMN